MKNIKLYLGIILIFLGISCFILAKDLKYYKMEPAIITECVNDSIYSYKFMNIDSTGTGLLVNKHFVGDTITVKTYVKGRFQ